MNDTLKNKFDSIIFDLDGTLWDSTANVTEAWQDAKQQVDYVRADVTRQMVKSITGMTYKAIFKKLFPYLDEEQCNEFMGICAQKEIEILQKKGGELYPNLEETLEYLFAKYKLFVVSNCQNDYIETFLNFSKLGHYFAGHQCYGTKNQPKAENIKDIIHGHQLSAPVYVGDTMGDFEACQKAGAPFIFAAYGFGTVGAGQITTIKEISDLVGIL